MFLLTVHSFFYMSLQVTGMDIWIKLNSFVHILPHALSYLLLLVYVCVCVCVCLRHMITRYWRYFDEWGYRVYNMKMHHWTEQVKTSELKDALYCKWVHMVWDEKFLTLMNFWRLLSFNTWREVRRSKLKECLFFCYPFCFQWRSSVKVLSGAFAVQWPKLWLCLRVTRATKKRMAAKWH